MSHVSLSRPLAFYTFALIVCIVAFTLLSNVIELPSSSVGVVSLIAATMPAGQIFYKAAGRLPGRGEKLRFALLATVIGYVVNFVALAGLFSYYGIPLTLAGASAVFGIDLVREMNVLVIVLGVATLISILLTYLFFHLGAKGAQKQAAKLAAKGRT